LRPGHFLHELPVVPSLRCFDYNVSGRRCAAKTDSGVYMPHGETEGSTKSEFEQQAKLAREAASGPVSEFLYFMNQTRKWWMAPIILALLTVGALLVVSGTALAPLIYALF
jgi:hypothetical protein